MSSFSNTQKHKSNDYKRDDLPVTASDGTAKRNIIRKHPKNGLKPGKSRSVLDDGSMYNDGPALNKNDPNYVVCFCLFYIINVLLIMIISFIII